MLCAGGGARCRGLRRRWGVVAVDHRAERIESDVDVRASRDGGPCHLDDRERDTCRAVDRAIDSGHHDSGHHDSGPS